MGISEATKNDNFGKTNSKKEPYHAGLNVCEHFDKHTGPLLQEELSKIRSRSNAARKEWRKISTSRKSIGRMMFLSALSGRTRDTKLEKEA